MHADGDWKAVEGVLNKAMAIVGGCLQTCKLLCICKCTSFAWKRDRHLAFYLSSIMGYELSLVSLRRTVLLLSRSGMRFRHCSSLISLRIAKTVANACAQHAFIPFKYIL